MDAKDILMHIDRTNEVAVAPEAAAAADPRSSPGLFTMPAARTPAAGSSFGAGEARDAGLRGFVGEIVDIAAVFPARHPLVVVPAAVSGAHSMRVADEERSHRALDAEVDDGPGGLVREGRARVAQPCGTPCFWRVAVSSTDANASGSGSAFWQAARAVGCAGA
jgi:hypothetical protein